MAVFVVIACGGAAAGVVAPSEPLISPADAVALAVNDLAETPEGFRLRNPSFRASFTPAGVRIAPNDGGPQWRWELTGAAAAGVDLGAVRPTAPGRLTVEYSRGAIIERYRLKGSSVEQQFVLTRAPFGHVRDMVIEGRIASPGRFEKAAGSWQWRNARGAVTLGEVTVFDARGRKLPARMRVTAETTRITVDAAALARAAYPVTVDPEIGANDFQISQFSTVANRDASQTDVTYNPIQNEYLVVWRGDGLATDDEFEIFGQRLSAATGAELGTNDFRISDLGPDASTLYAAANPAITFNSAANQYLVVWRGDDNVSPLVDDEFEIFGQRLSGPTGAQIGTNDFRISDMGLNGNVSFGAFNPAVAYKRSTNQFLVAWHGDDGTAPLVDGEFEIYGQLLDSGGFHVGTNDFRISDMGPDGNASFDANRPEVADNPTSSEFLVVWDGEDDTPPLVVSEGEIFGQRLSSTGVQQGTNDFRISDMGPDGATAFDATTAAVAHNSTANEYLVVWQGDDATPPLVDDEFEIFGQRVDAAGLEQGTNDFRISDMGLDGNPAFTAVEPAVAYNAASNDYLVSWRGDDATPPLVDNEFEIFGQRLDALGEPSGTNDFRISDMGPDGSTAYDPAQPAVTRSGTAEYLIVWQGDDDTPPLVNDAFEIFGQRHTPDPPTAVHNVAFAAERVGSDVALRWRTRSELVVLGFNVWRGHKRLNRALLPAKASGTARGASYAFLHRSARPGHVYRLEVVRLDGGRSSYAAR